MTAIDPVCGMTVDTSSPPVRLQYQGVDYYFCSKSCSAAFVVDPLGYTHAQEEDVDDPRKGEEARLRKEG